MISVKNMLPVMETFYTIQGEGYNTGNAAYFIRLAGCDVGCVWCDVKESWDEKKHLLFTVEKIVEGALQYPSRFVVITGGEPLMHDLDLLCSELHKHNFMIAMETSGAYTMSGEFDWVCVSPKKFKPVLPELLKAANELKVVVFNKSDFDWGAKNAVDVGNDCKLFLQPEYSVFDKMMPQIIDFVKDNPQWRISLQTHKIINVP